MQTALILFFAAAGAILAYQAISFVPRYVKSGAQDVKWCLAFAGLSSIHAFASIWLYTASVANADAAVMLSILIGIVTHATYIRCMGIYFGRATGLLAYAAKAIFIIGAVYACAILIDQLTLQELLITPKQTSPQIDLQTLPLDFVNHYEMTWITRLPHLSGRLIMIAALIYLLCTAGVKRDKIIVYGVVVSLLILAHNMIAVSFLNIAYLPLIPFMNLIEITRLEWLARRGESLRLEQYKARVNSFEQGIKEHTKFKQIGQEAASFIHDASNIAFVTDSKLSLAQSCDAVSADTDANKAITDARENNQQLMKLIASGRDDYLHHNADEPIDLDSVLADAMELTAYRLLSNKVHLTTQGKSQRTIYGDRVKLAHVFVNLINNACDAIADLPERWIRIEIEDDEDQTVIAITNSGEKMSDDLWDRVFSPFFSTKGASGGTGLGLKICRDNLAAMGGELLLNPSSEHTRFDIVLP